MVYRSRGTVALAARKRLASRYATAAAQGMARCQTHSLPVEPSARRTSMAIPGVLLQIDRVREIDKLPVLARTGNDIASHRNRQPEPLHRDWSTWKSVSPNLSLRHVRASLRYSAAGLEACGG